MRISSQFIMYSHFHVKASERREKKVRTQLAKEKRSGSKARTIQRHNQNLHTMHTPLCTPIDGECDDRYTTRIRRMNMNATT